MKNWTKNDLITLFWITVSALVFTFNINVFIYSGAFFPENPPGKKAPE